MKWKYHDEMKIYIHTVLSKLSSIQVWEVYLLSAFIPLAMIGGYLGINISSQSKVFIFQ